METRVEHTGEKAIVSPRCWGQHKREGGHEYHASSPGRDNGNEDEDENHASGSTYQTLLKAMAVQTGNVGYLAILQEGQSALDTITNYDD